MRQVDLNKQSKKKGQMILQVLLETGLLLVFLLAVGLECPGLCPDHQVVPLVLVHLGPGQPVLSHSLDAVTLQVHWLAFTS